MIKIQKIGVALGALGILSGLLVYKFAKNADVAISNTGDSSSHILFGILLLLFVVTAMNRRKL